MTITNVCSCCGSVLAFVGIQAYPPKCNRPAKVLVECNAYGCELYLRTGTAEGLADWWREEQLKRAKEPKMQPQFFTRFGSPIEILSVEFGTDEAWATVRYEDGQEREIAFHELRAPGGLKEIMDWLKSVGMVADENET